MKKPIRIQLEFSGYSLPVVDSEDSIIRPMTAMELAKVIAADIENKFRESCRSHKLKVKVTALP